MESTIRLSNRPCHVPDIPAVFNVVPDKLSVIEWVLLGSYTSTAFLFAFFRHWPPETIMQFACVSSRFRILVKWYSESLWDIDRFLSGWFQFPLQFRETMAFTGAMISGPQTLHFFDRLPITPLPLDVYVSERGLFHLARTLRLQRFQFLPSSMDEPTTRLTEGILRHRRESRSPRDTIYSRHRTFTFSRTVDPPTSYEENMGTRVVKVYMTSGDAITEFIESNHSTANMNFITGDRAFSMFPKTTFTRRLSVTTQFPTNYEGVPVSWLRHYAGTKFREIGKVDGPEDLTSDGEIRKSYRYVGDPTCWTIHLCGNSKTSRVDPFSVFDGPAFEVEICRTTGRALYMDLD
ncbi:hypothetical protein PLICRDRAFT_171543 [Plicaturopsis crispa FD-325 SS-3]|nr:hypothetical protein PLICRDRAFT_171543 [Plicaturopsis crispa FD-325 SS-3]